MGVQNFVFRFERIGGFLQKLWGGEIFFLPSSEGYKVVP